MIIFILFNNNALKKKPKVKNHEYVNLIKLNISFTFC